MKYKYYNNPEYKVSYLPIPKNGMSSIQRALKSREVDHSDKPTYATFCILRDPVDRFYSAYHELCKRGIFKGKIIDLLHKIKKDGLFDPHIFPQSYYFRQCDKNFTFPTAFTEIENWIGLKVPHLNKRDRENDVLDPKTTSMIKKMYEKDLKLYEKWLI